MYHFQLLLNWQRRKNLDSIERYDCYFLSELAIPSPIQSKAVVPELLSGTGINIWGINSTALLDHVVILFYQPNKQPIVGMWGA